MPNNNNKNRVSARSLIQHARPVRVSAAALRFTHTFGLGGMALVLFLILLGTGLLMIFVYEPTSEGAYKSIVFMQDETLFGRLIRGAHYWGANLLIAVTVLHLFRVFLTGAFHGLRRSNWLVGLGMLLLILVSGFTGYLLPWDQVSYWAITVCAEMLGYLPVVGQALQRLVIGGTEIGAATILNFYALHTVVVPLLLIVLMTWHFWRVRLAGGVIVPTNLENGPASRDEYLPYRPNLVEREKAVALAVIAIVVVIASVFGAPLDDPANPGLSPNPVKAPWYFIGLQELLLHVHPLFAILVIPVTLVLALIGVAYLRFDERPTGRWFLSGRGRRMSAVAAATAVVLTTGWVLVDEFVVGADGWLPGSAPVISDGLLPFAVLTAGVITIYISLKKYFAATVGETVQAMFVLFTSSYAVFTATGIWFRGAGMALVWPWQI
jgi:quinol-cytochrome oxidoreductase complex cytochrome b subunit